METNTRVKEAGIHSFVLKPTSLGISNRSGAACQSWEDGKYCLEGQMDYGVHQGQRVCTSDAVHSVTHFCNHWRFQHRCDFDPELVIFHTPSPLSHKLIDLFPPVYFHPDCKLLPLSASLSAVIYGSLSSLVVIGHRPLGTKEAQAASRVWTALSIREGLLETTYCSEPNLLYCSRNNRRAFRGMGEKG